MITRITASILHSLLLLAVTGTLVSGCAKARVAAPFDDHQISVAVKTALLNDLLMGEEPLDVDTLEGVVTLSGTVQSKEQEARAMELARSVKGVRDVKSAITMQAAPR